ncbi:hypothetical protein [Phenylobacterium sp.]|uniref:hypothetical protein n=1 Tax=Phenylobacterium sp. TaxID=1871053 RepID=UPI002F92DEF2
MAVAWLAYKQLVVPGPEEAPFRRIDGAASEAERAAAAALLTEAYGVLRSEDFQRNLRGLERRYPEIYASRSAGEVPLSRAAAWVSNETWGSRYASLEVELVGGEAPSDPLREHASAGGYTDAGVYARMSLGRAHVAQYGSSDPVEQSCAINVAAHELAHTISTTPFFFTNAFTDTRPSEAQIARRSPMATTAVGSYLVGAVAQCTWLQRQGRVGPRDLHDCLQVFGVRGMNWRRCTSFQEGQPVRPHADLPRPMTPL